MMRNKQSLNTKNETFFDEQETVEGLQHQAVIGASFLEVSIKICQKLASKFREKNYPGSHIFGEYLPKNTLQTEISIYAFDA